ncbi:NAD(P)-dependent dehydrogenase (short-subunit alcohol dehydrogenase family) [Virgibacillus campisalis]|uniref:NAD(P)-dependent dehydrogenase (Short-subunit alcohol dehydrogenase family) n=1 Tax=Virgibacillus alimentarius TaxID=698769 RepID=A0ABS4SA03_9BACI|nr:NAD(P)-dependent dehydrogenase (short-subunit alcohol dehydrogenase family) [Virgibacillus alimentarius]
MLITFNERLFSRYLIKFGHDSPMHRPGEPKELAPAFVYLPSNNSTYVAGQVIHVNGGTIGNG